MPIISRVRNYRQKISSGVGIVMLPSFVAAQNDEQRPVLPSYFSIRDIWISVHEDMLHVGRVKAIMKFLEKRISSDGNYLKSAKPTSKT